MMMISKKICARRTKSLGASTVDEVIDSVVPKGTKNTTSALIIPLNLGGTTYLRILLNELFKDWIFGVKLVVIMTNNL